MNYSTEDVDKPFRWMMNALLPSLVHQVAFHPSSPALAAMTADLREQLTTPLRVWYVCWDLTEGMRTAAGAMGVDPSTITAKAWGDGAPLEIDEAIPPHRALTRFVQCGLNNDPETAAAVFNTLPVEHYDPFVRGLLDATAYMAKRARPGGCGS